MGRKNKPSRKRQSDRRIYIRGDRRDQIDQRKLGRTLLQLAAAQAEAEARREYASKQRETDEVRDEK